MGSLAIVEPPCGSETAKLANLSTIPLTLTKTTLLELALSNGLARYKSIQECIDDWGFIQADPIPAPAKAADVFLFQRVKGYRRGMLEEQYPRLHAEEEYFCNYGFVSRGLYKTLLGRSFDKPMQIEKEHPETFALAKQWIEGKEDIHPKDMAQEFGKLSAANYWGGTSSAWSRILDALHYRQEVRVTQRKGNSRLFSPVQHTEDPLDRETQFRKVVEQALRLYAPMPKKGLAQLIRFCHYGIPHMNPTLATAKTHLDALGEFVRIEGEDWYVPHGMEPNWSADSKARVLSPFDPIVWDRRRFELIFGWTYRFEAYTPVAKRQLGYYAMPILYRGEIPGIANLSQSGEELIAEIKTFRDASSKMRTAVEEELDRFKLFLGKKSFQATFTRVDIPRFGAEQVMK